ncbi:MAG: transposase [Candidatus Marinimicrobia bacterium]|nr:transposase [Candidatus Neomarinimicrobiota bacterium]
MKQTNEDSRRQEAIGRYLSGEKAKIICADLERSRFWFYKWLKRYQSGDADWYRGNSHRPKCHPNQTPGEIEQAVVNIRKQLSNVRYSQTGAFAIQWEMEKLGLEPLPAWTINRILRRKGLISPRRSASKRKSSGINYPEIGWDIPNSVHQMDVVGPRYIKGDGRFYSHNLIDAYSHQVSLSPSRVKNDEAAVQALIKAWKLIGIPDFLQLDNALYYRGSNRWPRSFGLVIRFCLSLWVQPVFAPVGEPWRQGVIEKFNHVYDKQFFRNQRFGSFVELKKESIVFEQFHNENHHYSLIGGKTPNQVVAVESLGKAHLLDENYQLPKDEISLEEGNIHLIRFIRSDKVLNVFGEKFPLRNVPAYEYVVATICVEAHVIKVKLDDQLVEEIGYPVPVDW